MVATTNVMMSRKICSGFHGAIGTTGVNGPYFTSGQTAITGYPRANRYESRVSWIAGSEFFEGTHDDFNWLVCHL